MQTILRRVAAVGATVMLVFSLAAVVTGGSAAANTTATITSSGPLTEVGNSSDLNCSVNHTGDTAGEWYGGTACGTLLATGGTLYGPANIPAGDSASPRTTWTEVSQSAVTGSGTSGDPYKVVTVADAGTTGLEVTQTDTYVVGQESYRNDVVVTNNGASTASGVLYRGGDCYLQDSDFGYGIYDSTSGAITCTTSLDPGSRIEQMLPVTSGSSYFEGYYNTLWADIGTQQPLPNTCDCSTDEDNSLGLSWNLSLAAGASQTYSSVVTFSPLGSLPLTLTKSADQASVAAGAADGYTITANNPNVGAVSLSALTDTLPAGFTYQAGSTTGSTTADPSISGDTLTWSNVSVPGAGSASIHFGVTVSQTPGTYTDDAEGTASGFTVVGTGSAAPVTVTPSQVNHPPTAAPQSVTTPENTPAAITLTGSDPDGDPLTFAVATNPTHGTLSGSGANLTYTPASDYSGPDSFTFTANDGQATSAPATVSIDVTPTGSCASTPPVLDVAVSKNQTTAASVLTSGKVTTAGGGELILAFIAADGPQQPNQRVTGVSGGGLTWTWAVRANETWGTTEVWQAYASSGLNHVHIKARLAQTGFDGMVTVAAFEGAATSVGATGHAAALTGSPAVSVTPGSCNSVVWGVGHDWTHDTRVTAATGQTIEHQFLDRRVFDSYWVQSVGSPTTAGQSVTVSDTGPRCERWTMAAVEIPGATRSGGGA